MAEKLTRENPCKDEVPLPKKKKSEKEEKNEEIIEPQKDATYSASNSSPEDSFDSDFDQKESPRDEDEPFDMENYLKFRAEEEKKEKDNKNNNSDEEEKKEEGKEQPSSHSSDEDD